MVANRLDVFNTIGDGALGAREIARRCGSRVRSTKLLLDACVALGFLERPRGRYVNSPQALQLLVRGKPSYIGDGVNHADGLWMRWAHLTESVRTNRRASAPMSPEDAGTSFSDFILAMHNRALRTAQTLADNLDLSRRRQLFDAGGGPGTYSISLVRKNPKLKAIVFDLPPAIEIAKSLISKSGVADRISTRAGNYFRDDFEKGNDVVLFSAIFHAMAPRWATTLLRKAYASLARGGLVVVQETLIEESKVAPVFAALFSLNMLVNTGEGRSYSGKEIMSWMRETGFRAARVQALPPPAGTSLVIGRKP
jgi:predicted O-methyltransferase YrrM